MSWYRYVALVKGEVGVLVSLRGHGMRVGRMELVSGLILVCVWGEGIGFVAGGVSCVLCCTCGV